VSDSDKKRVLLIDDDMSLLVTLGDFLKFEGYEVTTADSGEAGLKRLETLKPHVIILDMSMPGMGGVGFLKEVSSPEGKPRYPILVLTARANMAEFFANVEVDGFVAKPCAPQDLLMEVSRIVFLRSERDAESGDDTVVRKVLVGDDDDDARSGIVSALGEAGFETSGLAKGAEVIERAVLDKPDVIVLKLILDNMNGDTIATILRDMPATSGIPVILFDDSGSGASAGKLRVSGSAASRFVQTGSPAQLVEAVNKVLE